MQSVQHNCGGDAAATQYNFGGMVRRFQDGTLGNALLVNRVRGKCRFLI